MSKQFAPKGFFFTNAIKAERAAANAENSGNSVIAEYDKLGGVIKDKNGLTVPMGTFWDFANAKPAKKAKIVKKVEKKVKKTAKRK